MTAPVAAAPDAAAPAPRRWGRLAAALLGLVIVPQGTLILFPVTRTLLLVLPALAAIMLAGWVAGGSALLAVAWSGVAALALAWPPASGDFDFLQRGWALALASAFGLVLVVRTRRQGPTPFLVQALLALGLAVGGTVMLAALSHGPPDRVVSVIEGEYGERLVRPIAVWEQYFASQDWTDAVAKSPAMATFGTDFLEQLRALPAMAVAYALVGPAMLALESLAALALAWALYQRLGRRPVGPALGTLREFRFSDHLVWGIALGLSLTLIPDVAWTRAVGLNLLVFFGALYALRGLGVLAWILKPGRTALVLLGLVSLLALPVVLPMMVAVSLGLGVGDTWLDWRTRLQSSPQSSE